MIWYVRTFYFWLFRLNLIVKRLGYQEWKNLDVCVINDDYV